MLQRMKSYQWVVGLVVLSFVMTGCFQSMTSDPSDTVESLPIVTEQQAPTWTPLPPLPTYTFQPTFTAFPTTDPTQFSTVEADTQNLSDPQQPPVDAVQLDPQTTLATATQSLEGISPAFLTATQIVAEATFRVQTLTATVLPQQTTIPTFTLIPDPLQQPANINVVPTVPGANCIYQVQTGDNLWQISLTFGVLMADIANASGIGIQSLLLPGQDLVIPACGTTGAIPPSTITPRPSSIPTLDPTLVPATLVTPFTLAPQNCNVAGGITHTVAQGETLFSIAQRYGTTLECILSANPDIANASQILVSDQIFVP